MPPIRFGYSMMSSIQPGIAAQLNSKPAMRSSTAALPCPEIAPCPAKSAVMMKMLWLLPPMAIADVPNQPMVRGCTLECGEGGVAITTQ